MQEKWSTRSPRCATPVASKRDDAIHLVSSPASEACKKKKTTTKNENKTQTQIYQPVEDLCRLLRTRLSNSQLLAQILGQFASLSRDRPPFLADKKKGEKSERTPTHSPSPSSSTHQFQSFLPLLFPPLLRPCPSFLPPSAEYLRSTVLNIPSSSLTKREGKKKKKKKKREAKTKQVTHLCRHPDLLVRQASQRNPRTTNVASDFATFCQEVVAVVHFCTKRLAPFPSTPQKGEVFLFFLSQECRRGSSRSLFYLLSLVFLVVALASAQCNSYCTPFSVVDPNSNKTFSYDLSSLALPDVSTSPFIQLVGGFELMSYLNICGTTNSMGCPQPNTVVCQNQAGDVFRLENFSSVIFATDFNFSSARAQRVIGMSPLIATPSLVLSLTTVE